MRWSAGRWRRQRSHEPQPQAGPKDASPQPEAELDDSAGLSLNESAERQLDDPAVHQLAVGIMITAADRDKEATAALLAGLSAADLIEVTEAAAYMGVALWQTRGSSESKVRDALQWYALQLAGANHD